MNLLKFFPELNAIALQLRTMRKQDFRNDEIIIALSDQFDCAKKSNSGIDLDTHRKKALNELESAPQMVFYDQYFRFGHNLFQLPSPAEPDAG